MEKALFLSIMAKLINSYNGSLTIINTGVNSGVDTMFV